MATIKELSIEEKAKRYDEAKEKAKVLKECFTNTEVVRYMDELFPDLAESEDERIRNYILSHLQQHLKTVREFSSKGMVTPFSSEEIKMLEASVVWLEKQGEQKSVVDTKVIIPKFRVGDIVKSKSQPRRSPRKIISIGKDCYWCEDRGCIGFAWEDDCEIVEQKPAWSEEDEKMLNDAIGAVGAADYYTYDDKEEIEHWLKSLRPQSHWEPSDEQMEALDDAIDICSKQNNDIGDWLDNLREQLKKLKEA